MTYGQLNTLFETIATTYQGLEYQHYVSDRINLYKGTYPAVFLIPPVAQGQTSKGDAVKNLSDIWTCDLLFLDQISGDWKSNSSSLITTVDTQNASAKLFLYYLENEEEITNNAGTYVSAWNIIPIFQGFTQTTAGVRLNLKFETMNTVWNPNC